MTRKKPVQRKRKSKRQQEFINSLLFFVVSILSISGLLTYLWVYNEINITTRENVALRKIKVNMIEENGELFSQITRLKRIDRITRIAEDELSMVTPEPETLVVYLDDSHLYKPGSVTK
ncbi:MAG: hypothetical protein QF613_00170 [Candidatus Marinimicrobia bacterium]|jgi:hypothetical protein|nr:hypothetical protein [Candidatus Neomarinimicrobiota bacterium]MDP6592615.1 hypothetical protein [Candidatus Neomarinimicrobiota bacterium]MDP6836654.1 hypothetical protein [Candidatus Neomarinimicrobiota bacterium]MDP6966553.1 hypothetical protein [Candidatus Neomarinimicrobiota bacterium]|tara:strand:+ start:351 stop:707 length:357 start_codon:yes stop_codon:yes gene_type:complete